jgi:hypothetical protein
MRCQLLMRTAYKGPLLLSFTLLFQACVERGEPEIVTVRDSAEVTIVDSRGPRSGPEEFVIGAAQLSLGGEGSELNRVVGAVRLSDGRVVIGDAGDDVLRYFSPSGEALGEVGGRGDGPAEFRSLQAIGLTAGDTVWAYDFSHHKVVWVAPDMTVNRTVTVSPPLSSGLAVGVLAGDTILLGESWSSVQVAAGTTTGLVRESVAYVRYSDDGAFVDTVGLHPGREIVISQENGRGVMSSAPFARAAVHAHLGGGSVADASPADGFAVGAQIEHEVRLFSSSGALRRIVRWDGGDLALDAATAREWRSAQLEAARPDDRAALRQQLADVELPDQRPAYGSILAAPDGSLWVAHFAPGGQEADRWDVFDPMGAWCCTATMPARFTPLSLGPDWVLGVSRDEMDVQHVELRVLVWSAPSGARFT